MSKKKIAEYFPEKPGKIKLIQARIDQDLYKEFKLALKSNNHSLKAFIEACMRKFIDENKPQD